MLVTYIKITEDRQELTRQHNLIMDCLGRRGLTPDIMLSYSDIRLLNREALPRGIACFFCGVSKLKIQYQVLYRNRGASEKVPPDKSFRHNGLFRR